MEGASRCATGDSAASRQFRWELRRWRLRQGLTQRALAERVRFSRETVAAVESGRRYGSREFADRCDEALATGGRLTALWPRVAAEQMAADGRRGPRDPLAGRSAAAGLAAPAPAARVEQSAASLAAVAELCTGPGAGTDPLAVAEAVDQLRELVDRMLHERVGPPGPPAQGRSAVLG
ncbi:helix-turn-helix transcriptional regulator [Plantactinospora sp. GCM10030261]|uniref:helix-turn-helix transcriptional regulator n=1 Tax=Plantactinospora sp. GCM10030261 TaxID=3273420 RepID=UPI00361FA169